MRVRRNVSSIPCRSAGETWQGIVDLITGPKSTDEKQLRDAGGVMGSIITDEHPAVRAIVIEGVGPQLRVYCRYGMRAVEEGKAVDALTWNPTAGDWTIVRSSHPSHKDEAHRFHFRVPVPADGEALIRYRLRTRWC